MFVRLYAGSFVSPNITALTTAKYLDQGCLVSQKLEDTILDEVECGKTNWTEWYFPASASKPQNFPTNYF